MSAPVPLAITGATGFVGQAVLDEAAARGLPVRALTRRPQQPMANVEWVQGGLDDAAGLRACCDGVSAVLHIAGLTNTPDPAQFEQANVAGTQAVIDAAKGARVKRFVFVSSLSAREPKLSAYGASKARAEALVQASGLDWTTVRPPGVYGPRDVDYFEMFRSAKLGVVPLPPRGASSIIHVTDLARLLLDLVDAQPALVRKKLFEPDDGRTGGYGHDELAQMIGRAVGRRRVFAPHLPARLLKAGARIDSLLRGAKARLTADRASYMAHPNWVSRSDRAVPKPVWQPEIGGEEGMRRTAAWYREEGWL
ncbi:NAD-dependent epimerase/dehydratase family protein [Paraurantiacibacter namhicola]|uniref:3 beta-hydroxysteroid dehydrogenase/Delta 5-->4-isomerase n=1 Tax=Paraurantiacibacter namhicola TaxID=645517 RepID=A0A1C7DAK9_9SPHN|nr:NAD(P)H-binding protein [Paraurantiacibacter namhicola]ANU08530.1 3 beta-hydroxysteroid dehydrogenase/Delta 5-->4-isomerase [Paraurantiacibacter namhicola]